MVGDADTARALGSGAGRGARHAAAGRPARGGHDQRRRRLARRRVDHGRHAGPGRPPSADAGRCRGLCRGLSRQDRGAPDHVHRHGLRLRRPGRRRQGDPSRGRRREVHEQVLQRRADPPRSLALVLAMAVARCVRRDGGGPIEDNVDRAGITAMEQASVLACDGDAETLGRRSRPTRARGPCRRPDEAALVAGAVPARGIRAVRRRRRADRAGRCRLRRHGWPAPVRAAPRR